MVKNPKEFFLPLMEDNINRTDLDNLISYLKQDDPRLTQAKNVVEFEKEWSQWLGVKYSVFLNSGASANLISINIIKELYGLGEIIVPPLTWVSDIACVIQCGFKPVFVDIDPKTLGMDTDQVLKKITSKTKAVFLTHILGLNALTQELLKELKRRKIALIEDVCESHGATFKGKKLGTFGLISNFSFYYAHHMSTVEGGVVCTSDKKIYEMARMFRSHGMVREAKDQKLQDSYHKKYPDLNPDFIFAFPAYNMRSTEINAVLGRSQLKKLDKNNQLRRKNFELFLKNLDPEKYFTDFDLEGSCNYAFILVLKKANFEFCEKVMQTLRENGIEFRRGTSGGGNQLRQPYLKKIVGTKEFRKYPNVDHIHFFGFYIGNYPTLEEKKILKLCSVLNNIK